MSDGGRSQLQFQNLRGTHRNADAVVRRDDVSDDGLLSPALERDTILDRLVHGDSSVPRTGAGMCQQPDAEASAVSLIATL